MSLHVDLDVLPIDPDVPATPLVDDDQLAALLGIDPATLTETDHQAQQAATSMIQNYVERMLLRGVYTERHHGHGNGGLQLLEYPVVEIQSFREVVNDVRSDTDVTGYRLIRPTGIVLGWWGWEVEVVYEAGYQRMPADIVLAFMQTFHLVRANLSAAFAGGTDALAALVSKVQVVGVGSVEYGDTSEKAGAAVGWGMLPATAVALLAPYRSHGPVGVG